ncbi:uncharacterized protein LOC105703360 [Orussus abietinus]|uniref:uncharacterized protein LOC105703360 n=1 Tax=Orussus abietinus TaxID=222816 RepID=UPI0006258FE7|nr:uncharacterized protein LOC105703360 [Orussus abietinus]
MAVASERATYGVKIAPFVSLNAYYGYVPPSPQAESECPFDGSTAGEGQPTLGYGSAMETDDDACDIFEDTRCPNNPCVIPEGPHRRFGEQHVCAGYAERNFESRVGWPPRDAVPPRRNRKRNSVGELALLGTAAQRKKLREDGGNNRVYRGSGGAEDHRLAEMYYEPSPLRLGAVWSKALEQPSMTVVESCCWAAGNISTLSNTDCTKFLTNGSSESVECRVEYERMLLETHGCSSYHLHRQQPLEGTIEAEF